MNKGVRDLMELHRFQLKHIQNELLLKNVPGNWKSRQNVYNLTIGHITPKDAYVYILLANIFEVDIETMLYRYSKISKTDINESQKIIDYNNFDF
jgi:hypothetical protein